MDAATLKTKDAILGFLTTHPGWCLQFCRGIRGNNWWWCRETPTSSGSVKCDGRAARAVADTMTRVAEEPRFDTTTYVFGASQPNLDANAPKA